MEPPLLNRIGRTLTSHLRTTMVAGVLILVPLVLTYLVLRLVFDFIDGVLQPAIEQAIDRRLPGLGILVLIVLIYIAGLVGANRVGNRSIQVVQDLLLKIPVIGAVYSPSRQLVESFGGDSERSFKRVVIVEYPRKGAWMIGFLTATTEDEGGNRLGVVYVPTAPTPNSGWVGLFPEEDIHDIDMTAQQAMSLVLSGGIVTPPRVARKSVGASSASSESRQD